MPVDFHQKEDKIASSASWNSFAASKTPNNKGSVNPFKMRQNELDSHIFEQTDYSQYKPAKKRNHDAEMDQKEQLAKH
jgi:hypothetical protein